MQPPRRTTSSTPPAAHRRGRLRRVELLVALGAAAAVIAGLAVPGVAGGAILLALAVALAVLTTAVQSRPDLAVGLDPRNWALRIVVVVALAAIGLVKLFHH